LYILTSHHAALKLIVHQFINLSPVKGYKIDSSHEEVGSRITTLG